MNRVSDIDSHSRAKGSVTLAHSVPFELELEKEDSGRVNRSNLLTKADPMSVPTQITLGSGSSQVMPGIVQTFGMGERLCSSGIR